jgi:hypothetical protein
MTALHFTDEQMEQCGCEKSECSKSQFQDQISGNRQHPRQPLMVLETPVLPSCIRRQERWWFVTSKARGEGHWCVCLLIDCHEKAMFQEKATDITCRLSTHFVEKCVVIGLRLPASSTNSLAISPSPAFAWDQSPDWYLTGQSQRQSPLPSHSWITWPTETVSHVNGAL